MTSKELHRLAADPKTPAATRLAICRQLRTPAPAGTATATADAPARPKVPRGMNRWEQQYAERLRVLMSAGEVRWFAFEPVRVRCAAGSYYKGDFLVAWADGRVTMDEVKGHERANDVTRWKNAAERVPLWTFRMLTKRDGAWVVTREVRASV